MTPNRHSSKHGGINVQLLVIIALLILMIGLTALSAWLYVQYNDQKTNVDSKIAVAEAAARKVQSEEDDVKIKAIEEEPNREFAGPDDYGRLSFEYPKNWSVYVAEDPAAGDNKYSAYLSPVVVPPITDEKARFGLKVAIATVPYDKALDGYRKSIEDGTLTSKPITINGHEGTRLDGNIDKEIRGSVAIFRVRDKTITVQTQAETFKEYFDKIIQTIDFND